MILMCRTCRGFLLLDIIMAILILTVAFLLTLGMIPFSMRAGEEASLHSIGLHLCEQEMERVLYAGYNQVGNYTVQSSFQQTTNGNSQTLDFTTKVSAVKLSAFSNAMYQVDVTTSWNYGPRTVSENLETLIYHP
jgi:type II secretory pathway pseudopilin PulG